MNGPSISHKKQLIKRVNGLFAKSMSSSFLGKVCLSGSVSHITSKVQRQQMLYTLDRHLSEMDSSFSAKNHAHFIILIGFTIFFVGVARYELEKMSQINVAETVLS